MSSNAKPTWRIACLGWGSLVWEGTRVFGGPLGSEGVRDLTVDQGGSWNIDGPRLPLEFARHSAANEIPAKQYVSIVVADGLATIQSLWAELTVAAETTAAAIKHAVERLAERENIDSRRQDGWIGRSPSSTNVDYASASTIEAWAASKKLDGVVWTALPPKWDGRNGSSPTSEQVVEKLSELVRHGAAYARKYVLLAPPQIQTPFRAKLEKLVRAPSMNSTERYPLACLGKDRIQRLFYCRVTIENVATSSGRSRDAWQYMVYANAAPLGDDEEFFEAEFVEVNETTLLSKTMSHQGLDQFAQKGIPEALILDVAMRSQRHVVSSSAHGWLVDDTESRTEPATKAWQRLVGRGLATYDSDDDRFTT